MFVNGSEFEVEWIDKLGAKLPHKAPQKDVTRKWKSSGRKPHSS